VDTVVHSVGLLSARAGGLRIRAAWHPQQLIYLVAGAFRFHAVLCSCAVRMGSCGRLVVAAALVGNCTSCGFTTQRWQTVLCLLHAFFTQHLELPAASPVMQHHPHCPLRHSCRFRVLAPSGLVTGFIACLYRCQHRLLCTNLLCVYAPCFTCLPCIECRH
jgi:hypothetical protein